MIRRLALACGIAAACLLALPAASQASPIQLVLPQSAAFSIIGHWCGGIQEKVYGTGFDAATGDPVGVVDMSTRCGGSGRDGGGHVTTYSGSADVTWNFAGQTVSYSSPATGGGNPSFSAYDAHGDQLYNQNNQAYLNVLVAAAPTGVKATPSGGRYVVSWTPDSTAPSGLITSSTVTATPQNPTAPVLTYTVTGNTANALIGPLEPNTTYQITVTSNDAAGPSDPSSPVPVITGASVTPPGAPTGLKAHWTAPGAPGDQLVATWNAAPAGDSPTDVYRIRITSGDGGGTFTKTVSGSVLSATFSVSDVPDWTIRVRAHDAAGWGPWSKPFLLGGT